MTMDYELDDVERQVRDGTPPRGQDPGELEAVEAVGVAQGDQYWCRTCARHLEPEEVTYEEVHDPRYGGCGSDVSLPLLPAQGRIRELEEELAVVKTYHEGAIRYAGKLKARLSRLRPVVGAALRYLRPSVTDTSGPLEDAVDALTPEDRAWAEGEG